MTEGDLLYLSACLVGHRVGQPDSVDVVPHHGDMAERRDQRAGVPARLGSNAAVPTWASQSRGRA
jgi:hypothetical protein